MLEVKQDPFSGAEEYVKTDFRVKDALDHVEQEVTALKPVFAYPGTDKGVAK